MGQILSPFGRSSIREEFLEKSARANYLSHAYLFVGSEYIDKLIAAKKFIETLRCDFLDLLIVEPEIIEKKEIKKISEITIEKIRDLQYQLSLSPLKSQYRVAMINQAERMTKEAANALLKTLEEPFSKSILILITSFPDLILSTIKSRCQIIKFPAPPIKNFRTSACLASGRDFLKEQKTASEELNNLIKSDLTVKYKHAENLAKNTVLARKQLGFWLIAIRDAILSKINCREFLISSQLVAEDYSLDKLRKIFNKIKQTNNLLSNSSTNARLALEVLMLEI